MAAEEHRRIALHRAAAASWGEENADTLVDLVTPAGHEMATKADIETVLAAIAAMDERWETRFARMEERLDASDGRLSAMDERWETRFAGMEERLDATDGRLSAMDERWDERLAVMDQRWNEQLAAMDERRNEQLAAMDGRWNERLAAMDGRWDERLSDMNERWASQLEATEHRLTATFERGLRDAVTTQTRVVVISVLVAVVTMGGLTLSVAS